MHYSCTLLILCLYYNEYFIWKLSFLLAVSDLSVSTSVAFAQLSWNVLPTVSIDMHVYEVGFAVSGNSGQCSQASFPLPYINTTNGSIELTGLLIDTCYVFIVRVYSLRTGQPGNWSIIFNSTLQQG